MPYINLAYHTTQNYLSGKWPEKLRLPTLSIIPTAKGH